MADGVGRSCFQRFYKFADWPLSVPAYDGLTAWRDATGCGPGEKCFRRVVAVAGYAGLSVAGVVDAAVKIVFTTLFLLGACAPRWRSKALLLAEVSSAGIALSLLVSLVSIFSLLENLYRDRMSNPPW